VTPLSLSIETLGSIMPKYVSYNTTIPTKKSQVFSTVAKNLVVPGKLAPALVDLNLDGCLTVSHFNLHGILPVPKGISQIKITFNIDAGDLIVVSSLIFTSFMRCLLDGIVNVLAKDKARCDLIEESNKAESVCHGIKKNMYLFFIPALLCF
jgi:molecular chaperone DnaK